MNRPDIDMMEAAYDNDDFAAEEEVRALIAYVRELEDATVVVKCTGCAELSTLERLAELIKKHRYMNSPEEMAELILSDLRA